MRLIDNNTEMLMIKQLADKMHKKPNPKEGKCESYFLRRDEKETRVLQSIDEYGFHTPVELKQLLEKMWKELDDEMMQEFVTVCSVAAFKNRKNKEEDRAISSYVYEF